MPRRYTLHAPAAALKLSIPYREALNPEQYQVVTEGEGPCLVLAGAGSGKTRTLVYRVAYLLEKGVPPQNILLVTFTNKAAREMVVRLETLLKTKPKHLWAGTFHHIANVVLRRYARELSFTPDFGILDEEDSRALLKACMESLKIKTAKSLFPRPGVVQTILSFSVNSGLPISEVLERRYDYFLEHAAQFEAIAELYHKRKKLANSMDYDDLLTYWNALLDDSPQARRALQEQFHYVLVDEYQDTNRLQHRLIQLLAERHQNLLVVGDDAQSIYSFRAADVQNILEFPTLYPKAKIFRLETNYRSTPEILNLANHSIEHNKAQFQKTLHAIKTSGEKPALAGLKDTYQQSAFITQRVVELHEEGMPLHQIAVLFRARYQAAELELELVKRNIPYILRGGVRFFEQAHIKDVLSHLRVVTNPRDEVSWRRILALQEGVGPASIEEIWRAIDASEADLSKILEAGFARTLSKRSRLGLQKLRGLLSGLSKKPLKDSPKDQILDVLQSSYKSYIQAVFENAADRVEDIQELANLAASHDKTQSFLSEVTLREEFKGETARGGSDQDRLILTTIHQAKGLEWNAVFLMSVVEGQFPHARSLDDPTDLEEERRLFYVAVTRAKEKLALTYPLVRYDRTYGETLSRASLFVQELPETAFERWEISSPNSDPLDW